MEIEKWEIEAGPITSEDVGGFMDVRYSIRYPRGTFQVTQRMRNSKEGYVEAHNRVQRMVAEPDKLRLLASAMRKVLPPTLLQEVIDHCNPLGEFLRELRD